jgi:hypothetical protein
MTSTGCGRRTVAQRVHLGLFFVEDMRNGEALTQYLADVMAKDPSVLRAYLCRVCDPQPEGPAVALCVAGSGPPRGMCQPVFDAGRPPP